MKLVFILIASLSIVVFAATKDDSSNNTDQIRPVRDAARKEKKSSSCPNEAAYKEFKKATNWQMRCNRIEKWNEQMNKKADKRDSFRVGHDALDNAMQWKWNEMEKEWKSGSNCAENETIIDAISTLSICSKDVDDDALDNSVEDGSVGINCKSDLPNYGWPEWECPSLCKDQFKSTKDAFEVN